jgi:large subunit ribosomal protein L30
MAVKERRAKKSPEERKTGAQAVKPQEKKIKIKLVRSLIGYPQTQREVVKGLGLRKVNSEVVRRDCPEIWGMVKKVPHLVKVEVLEQK